MHPELRLLMAYGSRRVFWFVVSVVMLVPVAGVAQTDLLNRLVVLQDELVASELAPDEKTALGDEIKAARSLLSQCELLLEEKKKLSQALDDAESLAESTAIEIEQWKKKSADAIPASMDSLSLVELEQEQRTVRETIESLKLEIQGYDTIVDGQINQRDKLKTELGRIAERLTEVETMVQNLGDSPANLQGRIRLTSLEVAKFQLECNQTFLENQQKFLVEDDRYGLTRKKRELANLKLAFRSAEEKQLTEALNLGRQQAAKKQAAIASSKVEEVRRLYPVLVPAEEITAAIADKIQKIEEESATVETRKRELAQELGRLDRKYRETVSRIDKIGGSGSVAALLRKRKSELPTSELRLVDAEDPRQRIEELQGKWFELDEMVTELSSDTIRDDLLGTGNVLTGAQWEQLEQPVAEIISRRKKRLESYRDKTGRLFELYLDVESDDKELISLSDKFRGFINERILWIQSNKWLFAEWELDERDGRLVSVANWQSLSKPALKAFNTRPIGIGFVALLLLVLLILGPTLRQRANKFGEVAKRGSCATFWPTARATVLTLLISLTVPLVVLSAGWVLLSVTPTENMLFNAFASALFSAGCFAVPLEIIRRVCRPKGLAVNHFDWDNEAVAKLKRHLTWYVVPASLVVFVVGLFINIEKTHRVDLIERIVFVFGMLLTTWFLFKVFSPRSGIFSQYLRRHENSWANQTSGVWFTFILLIPISVGFMAVSGYYYTALNLTRYLFATLSLAVGIELLRALIRRFILVRRRHAHIEQARRERKAELEAEREAKKRQAAERKRKIEAGESVEDVTTLVMTSESMAELQFEPFDIDEIAGQAKQLIWLIALVAWGLGIFLIWSDVLPAMKALDDYKIWRTETVQVDSAPILPAEIAGASDASPNSTEEKRPASTALISLEAPDDDGVSLRDLLVFIVIVLITFFAARNLPNALEMLFLEELPVDRSARYATKSLFSYAIIVLGAFLALRTLSINWSNIQWLVTALTFGLAFGLQEIFANFVAGIILMFERPMRIGDLITVDQFTGVVTRIRTRATTIVNWDRKEYVIPNKDFITGRLINWTLSDAINRIQFTVGIAYGSDVALAKRLLFEICNQHPSIVSEPPTSITFEDFGESSLNVVVRTFIGEVDSRLPVRDDLHMKINSVFAEHGIEIAFPQRDLHVRSVAGPWGESAESAGPDSTAE